MLTAKACVTLSLCVCVRVCVCVCGWEGSKGRVGFRVTSFELRIEALVFSYLGRFSLNLSQQLALDFFLWQRESVCAWVREREREKARVKEECLRESE